ncbi:penicillin-binding transpeptidase domain-containing protein [Cupriavidus basilensis]
MGESASHVIGLPRPDLAARPRNASRHMDEAAAPKAPASAQGRRQLQGFQLHRRASASSRSYETELHGLTGFEEVEVSAGGRPIPPLSTSPPRPATNLILSLDIRLQQLAEALLGDKRGALVAIEPATGDILAVCFQADLRPQPVRQKGSAPIPGTNSTARRDKPAAEPLGAARAPTRPARPGKPFMALAALSHRQTHRGLGHARSGTRSRWATIPSATTQPGGHGWVDMNASIVHVVRYLLLHGSRDDMGVNAIHDFMKPLGFGQITGIDIEGESRGILPSTEWKQRAYTQALSSGSGTTAKPSRLGIGQGYNKLHHPATGHAPYRHRWSTTAPRWKAPPGQGGRKDSPFNPRPRAHGAQGELPAAVQAGRIST